MQSHCGSSRGMCLAWEDVQASTCRLSEVEGPKSGPHFPVLPGLSREGPVPSFSDGEEGRQGSLGVHLRACVLSRFTHVRLFVTQ